MANRIFYIFLILFISIGLMSNCTFKTNDSSLNSNDTENSNSTSDDQSNSSTQNLIFNNIVEEVFQPTKISSFVQKKDGYYHDEWYIVTGTNYYDMLTEDKFNQLMEKLKEKGYSNDIGVQGFLTLADASTLGALLGKDYSSLSVYIKDGLGHDTIVFAITYVDDPDDSRKSDSLSPVFVRYPNIDNSVNAFLHTIDWILYPDDNFVGTLEKFDNLEGSHKWIATYKLKTWDDQRGGFGEMC